jgi:chromosome segregation protein
MCPVPARTRRAARAGPCRRADDGRALAPGEWLVTRPDGLRRWDGFVAAAKARPKPRGWKPKTGFGALEAELPALRSAAEAAEGKSGRQPELATLQPADRRRTRRRAARPRPNAPPCARSIRPKPPSARLEPAAPNSPPQRRSGRAARAGRGRARQSAEARRAALPDPEPAAPSSPPRRPATMPRGRACRPPQPARRARSGAGRGARTLQRPARRHQIGWQARAGDAASRLAEMAAASRRSPRNAPSSPPSPPR